MFTSIFYRTTPKWKINHICINRRVDKLTALCSHNAVLLSKKKWATDTQNNLDESQKRYYVKWRKSDREECKNEPNKPVVIEMLLPCVLTSRRRPQISPNLLGTIATTELWLLFLWEMPQHIHWTKPINCTGTSYGENPTESITMVLGNSETGVRVHISPARSWEGSWRWLWVPIITTGFLLLAPLLGYGREWKGLRGSGTHQRIPGAGRRGRRQAGFPLGRLNLHQAPALHQCVPLLARVEPGSWNLWTSDFIWIWELKRNGFHCLSWNHLNEQGLG